MKNWISLLVLVSFLLVTLKVTQNSHKWEKCSVLKWDISGYHLYLPAVFIYDDVAQLKFYDHIDSVYKPTGDWKRYSLYKNANTGKVLNKYPCGVAVFQLPLFLIAKFYCSFSSTFPIDGYSAPFQLATELSTILFAFLAFIILRKFLRNYFNDHVVAVTLIILAFGTNIYHYTAVDQGLSHIYLLFLYAAILYITDCWYKNATYKLSVYLGLALGMTLITRPTDIFIIFIPLFWKINNFKWLLDYLKLHKIKILISFICILIPVSLQVSYWKFITGHWIYFSYEGEHFDFLQPHILDGLFSFRKGWFVYTPLALLGFTGIVFMMVKRIHLNYTIPFLIYFTCSIYVIFSWSQWFYGGSFGCRAMIQSLALLALPIAVLTEALLKRTKKIFVFGYFLIIISGITLNFFQSWQYARGIIHWDSMNQKYYWRIFGKTSITKEDSKLLEQ